MGFRKGAYATVWSVQPVSSTLVKAQISTSHKSKDGGYETDFSSYVAFVTTAVAAKAARLKERDRIKLGDVDVTTKFDKAKNTMYTNFKVFSFETQEEFTANGGNGRNSKPAAEPDRSDPEENDLNDSKLPF